MDYAELLEFSDDFSSDEPEYLTKCRKRALRRVMDMHKARDRRYVDRKVHYRDWYSHLHQYSKGKIHCSCNLCRFRPNWDPDNKPMQDMRQLEGISCQMSEYLRGDMEVANEGT